MHVLWIPLRRFHVERGMVPGSVAFHIPEIRGPLTRAQSNDNGRPWIPVPAWVRELAKKPLPKKRIRL